MKLNRCLLLLVLVLPVARGQFANLTFNNANLGHLREEPGRGIVGPVEELLDGWTVSLRPPGGDWIAYTQDATYSKYLSGSGPIALNYGLHPDPADLSVYFRDYLVSGGPEGTQVVDIKLSTSGTVPIGAQTLGWFNGSGLRVSMTDGIAGVLVKGEVGQIDVSKFAGRDVVLSFTSTGFSHEHVLDVTGFTLIPEPTVVSLSAFGLAFVVGVAGIERLRSRELLTRCWIRSGRGRIARAE